MGGKKNMKAQLEQRARLYSCRAEIEQDQEAVVNRIFDTNPDFAYLKDSPDLSARARAGCTDGIRQGIARFMEERHILDIRDVFERDNFSNYFHDDQKYIMLENRLKSDPVLRKRLCDTEEDSVYECGHIAEVIGCEYVNEVFRKELIVFGASPSIEIKLDYIDMPDKENKSDY